MHVGETQMIKVKCAELHQITHHQQLWRNEMEGTGNTLVEGLGNVPKEVDLQTKRHDSMLTMHSKALVAIDEKSKALDDETGRLKLAAWGITQRQQKAVTDTQQGVMWIDQEGWRRDQTAQNRNGDELHQMRGELRRLKTEINTRISPVFNGSTPTNVPGNPAPGKVYPVRAWNPVHSTGKETTPLFAPNWSASPPMGSFTPRTGWNIPPNNGSENKGFAPAGHANVSGMITQPSIVLPNGTADACPAFTPATYARWKRELKLRISAQNGATITQLLAKIIDVLMEPAKVDGLEYMEETEQIAHTRDIETFFDRLDCRYSKTDAGKSRAWLTALAQFSKTTNEAYGEFWSRFQRCANRLYALQMALSPMMISNMALRALNIPESQLPIVLSALETKNNPNDMIALNDITIRMFETHRVHVDRTDFYTAGATPEDND